MTKGSIHKEDNYPKCFCTKQQLQKCKAKKPDRTEWINRQIHNYSLGL